MRLIDLDELPKGRVEWEDIFDAPIVDAVKVVKSKWVEAEDIGDCCYTCLNCGFVRDAYLLDTANYCPNCGAKMEEEE